MKYWLVFVFLMVNSITSKAQTAEEVDAKIKLYPKAFSSVDRLADRIRADFTTESAKARAVYTWIALNISYDLEKSLKNESRTYTAGQEQQLDNEIIRQTLAARKAVCEGYSRLFRRLATSVGLESEVINGYARTGENEIGMPLSNINHAWNSVKINGKWCLIDVTWGSGSYNATINKVVKEFNSFYFDTPPHLFFLKHFPENGMWLNEKISKEEFISKPLFYYDDSNAQYELIEPKEGLVVVAINQKIKFKIANLTEASTIFYTTKLEYAQEVTDKKVVGNAVEFELTIDQTFDNYLTLYIDDEAFVTYKIVLKG